LGGLEHNEPAEFVLALALDPRLGAVRSPGFGTTLNLTAGYESFSFPAKVSIETDDLPERPTEESSRTEVPGNCWIVHGSRAFGSSNEACGIRFCSAPPDDARR